ncbi:tricarballylate dehydrogenase [compost metagenome]
MTAPVVVVGAGAAGLMAAIAAARAGAPTILLEKTKRFGYKILISGHGRCNLTNAERDVKQLITNYPGGGKFLYGVFSQFDNWDFIRFIEGLGLPTKTDHRGRVYPESDKSLDVVDAFQRELDRLGVQLRLEAPGSRILTEEGRAVGIELGSGEVVKAGALVITVGGQSFPNTGSTGDGYRMAEELGHTLVDPFPSLVPLRSPGLGELAGLSLRDVEVTAVVDGKPAAKRRADMMFAHFGLTGPAILHLSRTASLAVAQGKTVEFWLDLVPDRTREELDADLRQTWERTPRTHLANALKEILPERLVPFFLAKADVAGDRPVSEVPKKDRAKLVERLKRWAFPIPSVLSKEVAEVTAGGLNLKEVDPKSMASKRIEGLFWAGEVLDVDGFIGGYNFQSAWSTGWVAGQSAARSLGYSPD